MREVTENTLKLSSAGIPHFDAFRMGSDESVKDIVV